MTTATRDVREELARAMAKLGGVSYANQLDDGAEELFPYYSQADELIEEGFGKPTEVTEDLVWEALEPHLETVIDLDLNSYKDNRAFQKLVEDVTLVLRSGGEEQSTISLDSARRREMIARILHDANTGRITPDPDDPTRYGAMADAIIAAGL